jgi:uroporphyrinogen-III synthase
VSLDGVRVVVTRPEPQNQPLAELLRARGAEPILLPVLEIGELDASDRIREAVTGLVDHDWVLFTSATAVDVFARRLHDFYDPVLTKAAQADRIPKLFGELTKDVKVGAVGEATMASLARHSVAVDLVPDSASGAALAESLGSTSGPESTVLLPRSDAADDVVVEILRANGWSPNPVALYGPRAVQQPPAETARVQRGEVDVLTFASGSAVRAFVDIVGSPARLGSAAAERWTIAVVCIGPKTARAARDAGFEVSAVAEERSDAGMVSAIASLRS